MIVAFDYNLLITSAATVTAALVGGIVGYGTARLGAGVSVRRIEDERDRFHEQLREERLRTRQTPYINLLNRDRRLGMMISERSLTEEAYFTWSREYNEELMWIALFAPGAVARAALRLYVLLDRIDAEIRSHKDESEEAFRARVDELVAKQTRRWQALRLELIDAIRADAAADAEPIGWRTAQEVMGEASQPPE